MSPRSVSFVPRTQSRAIDRLARGAHAFHRFAHHPLCGEYEGEVVRIGRRIRVCRGCSFAALGGLIGLFLGAIVGMPLPFAVVLLAAAGALVAAVPRTRSKLPSRFLPSVFAAAAAGSGARAADVPGALVALAALGVVAVAVLRYRRRGPDRRPCVNCPERDRPVACRGYARIVRRERAFRRVVASRFRLEELGP